MDDWLVLIEELISYCKLHSQAEPNKKDKRVQIYMLAHMHIHIPIHKGPMGGGTYWGEWWHIAVWPPELQLWDHLRRAGPRGYTSACFHGCRRRTRARWACWCCSGWGSHCPRSLQAGSTCSSHGGWNLPFVSGCWQCYLWKDTNVRSLSARTCFT